MKKRRFKLKPVPPAAPPPAAAEPPRPAAPNLAAAFAEAATPILPAAAAENPPPDLAAAFAEAIETLRRNLHSERPAAQNQAAFLLYKIYSQEVKLPAVNQSLCAIEADLGLKGCGQSLPARLRQIERATAAWRAQADERREAERAATEDRTHRRERSEALAIHDHRRPAAGTGAACPLMAMEIAELTGEQVGAETGLPLAESEPQGSDDAEILRAPAANHFPGAEVLRQMVAEAARPTTPGTVSQPVSASASAPASALPPGISTARKDRAAVEGTEVEGGRREEMRAETEASVEVRRGNLATRNRGELRNRAPDKG